MLDDEYEDENNPANFNEEDLIRYYFNRGFKYEEIIQFLAKYYNHSISYSTLLRRLKQYGLKRRDQLTNDIFIRARARISDIINGPGSAGGYRTVWHTLELEGMRVPRIVVQEMLQLVSDLGTENSLAATMQSFFRDNPESHSKNRTIWWRNLFKDMESEGEIDLSSELSKACLWHSFHGLLQQECDFIKEHWNTHYIRRSRHETVSGRPDSLFFLPEMHNAENLIKAVEAADIAYAKNHLLTLDVCEYTEYVEYIAQEMSAPKPATWQEACTLNRELMNKINEIN
eukprot:gene6763-7524_t